MKLLHCLECKDVKALVQYRRKCACGKSWGQYNTAQDMATDRKVTVVGPCTVLGIPNEELGAVSTFLGDGKWFVLMGTSTVEHRDYFEGHKINKEKIK